MEFNILNELRRDVGSVSEYKLNEAAIDLTDATIESLHGRLQLLRTDEGILASVDAVGWMDERCARCLKRTRCDVTVRFQEEYVPIVDATTGARIHLPEGDERFRIRAHFLLDLREALRQYILISEPIKPLCTPGCAGLCPACGTDLNERTCNCAPAGDERWRALKALKDTPAEGR
jgi:uncharacterized protein